jgi:phosphoribosylformylglycinamidine cyclo-ligase
MASSPIDQMLCFAAPAMLRPVPTHVAAFRISRRAGAPARQRRSAAPAVRRVHSSARATASSAPPASGDGLSYAASGVDIDVETASVAALVRALGARAKPRRVGELGALVDHAGGFSGLVEFGDRLLAMCTDGVGSKLMLCAELEYYESVALDCMAMNVNDLICIGAEPLAFVDYIAAPRPSPEIWAALGRSLGKACELARVSLCGGETATLPDMVKEIDMSGTALGWLPRGEQLDGRSITPGDVVIGLPSSGIHSNGFSLARKVLDRSGLRLKDPATFIPSSHPSVRAGHTLWRHTDDVSAPVSVGEVLLNPTQIYVDPLVDMFRSMRNGDGPCPYGALRGIAHITGGGLSNLLRLHPTLGFHISSPLRPLPEFEWMQRVGSISNYEMYRTFNMGMGMAIVVSAEDAGALAVWLSSKMPGAQVVGFVNTSGTVTHSLPDVLFDKY